MYATEGPDNGNIYYRSGLKYIRGENDNARHHIYFYDNGEIRYGVVEGERDKIAHDQAHKMAKAAVSALSKKECEIAAFYLGQMTHYIADLSNFVHVLHKDQIENCVSTKKDTFERRILRNTNKQGREDFFFVDQGIISGLLTKDPSELAIYVANKNRFGDIAGNYYTAKEFDEHYISLELDETAIWYPFYRNNPKWPKPQKGFDTVEWNLNNAIDACAAALDWVIDTAKFKGCKYNKEDMSRVHDSLASKLANTIAKSFTKLMIWLGQWAVIYAGGAEAFKEVSKKIPIPT